MQKMDAAQLHREGIKAAREGRLGDAFGLISRAIQMDGGVAEYHFHLGEILRLQRKFDASIDAFGRATALRAGYAEALNGMGLAYRDQGLVQQALAAFNRAVEMRRDYGEAWSNLGTTLLAAGRMEEAIQACESAAKLLPDSAEAQANSGVALREAGRFEEAIHAHRRAVQLRPDAAWIWNNLGVSFLDAAKPNEAIDAYEKAIGLDPRFAAAHYNRAVALADRKPGEAIASAQGALKIKPDYVDAYNLLAGIFRQLGRLDEAITHARQAIALQSNHAKAHSNLGAALHDKGAFDEAVSACRQAIAIDPKLGGAYSNLGKCLKELGQVDEAIECFRKAVELSPGNPEIRSGFVYTLHFQTGCTADELRREHRRWQEVHAEPLKKNVRRHDAVKRDPDRGLRIGYVSSDFRQHPVGRFLRPILANHNHEHFHISCYSNSQNEDSVTEQLRSSSDSWRSIVGMSDDEAAELIREDRIDLLVDLNMHTAGNRLLVFARKPAPVQMTYLAYCSTTGLEAMDYRITDSLLDPPEENDSIYSERSVYLPGAYWCYTAAVEMQPSDEPPVVLSGTITFGCLNSFARVSNATLDAWGSIMAQAPASRLILHAPEGSARRHVQERLSVRGIDASRVTFVGRMTLEEYFTQYQQIDIALDPFPYVGGTTTCDALWMGVPVVSLAGKLAVSRSGLTLLSAIGLRELVANSVEEYVGIAVRLAGDKNHLMELRRTLRPRMESSPLMDAMRFTRGLENVYREVWRRYCAGTR
jgi:protein O-GlcNAc transferase